jgi:subtilisin family serine protease
VSRSRPIAALAFAVALSCPASASAARFDREDEARRFVRGEAIVRYEAGVGAAERRELRDGARVRFEAAAELPRAQLVSFDGAVGAAIARLEDQPGVLDAQPNYRYHALAVAPDDTHFGSLWGLGSIPGAGVLPAWDRSRGAGQVIAIVDTGVDLTHPDLAANLWTKPGQPGVHGHDFVDGDTSPDDYNMHGTHVAGTAAAIAGNALGVAGVAPQAQIMAVRVLDGDGTGSTLTIANGITYAANEGAGVINLSLGGTAGTGDQAMQSAVSQAEQKGAVVVAAAGNGGADGVGDDNDVVPTTPCTLPNANLVCVAAVTNGGARSSFSNYGSASVDLGAPGGDGSGTAAGDILSAKASWESLFFESFEAGLAGWTSVTNQLAWGQDDPATDGVKSAADSPGSAYANDTESSLTKSAPVSLAGRRGCRLQYDVSFSINDIDPVTGQPFDYMGVGVLSAAGDLGQDFFGDSGPGFERVEQSISDLDGRTDVAPTLRFHSDSLVQDDGGYVDSFHVLCRAALYDDTVAPEYPGDGGSYTALAGTSMAAPHVAGVAALVRAVDPGAPPSQVVQALRNGAKPVAGMSGRTVSGGVVDAVGAMDAALALSNDPPPPRTQPNTPVPPVPPRKPRLGTAKLSRTGVLTIAVSGEPGASGELRLSAKLTSKRARRVGRKAFRLRSGGRATVKVKLERPARRQLKRKRRLRVTAKAITRNAAGLGSSATKSYMLRAKRRRG